MSINNYSTFRTRDHHVMVEFESTDPVNDQMETFALFVMVYKRIPSTGTLPFSDHNFCVVT